MRKLCSIILSLSLIAALALIPATAFADDTIYVYINNNRVSFDQPPIIVNDRTMVPIRAISESFDAAVSWDGESRTIGITLQDINISLTIDNPTAYINSNTITLDQPPIIVNDRTLVPLRFVSEAFGAEVEWSDMMRAAFIYLDQRPYYAQKVRAAVAERLEEDFEITEELMLLFMKYYDTFAFELDYLPDFEFASNIVWDNLAIYIFMNAINKEDPESISVSRELFDNTVNRLFGGLDYEHRATEMLDLKDEGYVPTGWGIYGNSYYRLTGLSVDAKGIYAATFDELITDVDVNYAYNSKDDTADSNVAAFIQQANGRDISLYDAIAELFVQPDYTEVLDIYRTLEVVFFIADNTDSAFTYLSSRTIKFY